jgi:hypothetical protein
MPHFSLNKRLDKLVVKLDKLLGATVAFQLGDAFCFDLFADDELETLYTFLKQIDARAVSATTGKPTMNDLTIEKKDVLESWSALNMALIEGTDDTAERCRRYLSLSEDDKEAIHQAFLHIDERCFPDISHCSKAPTMQWDGSTQYIYRNGYRWYRDHLEQPYCKGAYLRRWEVDHMWMWIHVAEQTERLYA